MNLVAELEERLNQYDLAVVRSFALAHARKVLTFAVGEAETYAVPGSSRAGGDPDLPPGMAWPAVESKGQQGPMTFVAQLDLAAIAPHDPTGLLPDAGLLLFFFGNDEPSVNIPHKVIYVPPGQDVVRAVPTEPPLYTRTKSHLFGPDAQQPSPFHGMTLVPRQGLNIPSLPYAEEALDRLTDSIEDDELAENLPEIYDMLAKETDGSWLCKCFGYGEEQNGDLEYEAALRIHADEPYDCFKDSALATLTRHFQGDEARAKRAVNDAILLLEVRSDCHTGFLWGNTGVIHFFIDREDLKAGRFHRTFCGLYYA